MSYASLCLTNLFDRTQSCAAYSRLMDWTQTLARLKADRGNWRAVANATGINPVQVRRIANGETTRPRIDTVQKLVNYYERHTEAA